MQIKQKFSVTVWFSVWLFFTVLLKANTDDVLVPYLLDLEGWSAEQGEGLYMDMGEMKTISATREYKKGNKELIVIIMKTNQSMPYHSWFTEDISIETKDGKMETQDINGYKSVVIKEMSGLSGTLVVLLNKTETDGSIISFNFKNISMSEVIELAKKFNWEKMSKQMQNL